MKLPSPHVSISQVSLALICCGGGCVNQLPTPGESTFCSQPRDKEDVGQTPYDFTSAVSPPHSFPVLLLVT